MVDTKRHIDITERSEIPLLSTLLGYGPMIPFITGAVAAWTLTGFWKHEAVLLTIFWAAAILAFLAGVRRGLSFRTEGGPSVAQIVTMFCLFFLALGSLLTMGHGLTIYAVSFLLPGYVAIMALDPIAARRGQAPLFFAKLRQPQMAIAVLSLAAVWADIWLHT